MAGRVHEPAAPSALFGRSARALRTCSRRDGRPMAIDSPNVVGRQEPHRRCGTKKCDPGGRDPILWPHRQSSRRREETKGARAVSHSAFRCRGGHIGGHLAPTGRGACPESPVESGVGVDGDRCCPRSSKPLWGYVVALGGFDSHALPPPMRSCRVLARGRPGLHAGHAAARGDAPRALLSVAQV